uniref:Uncharacterized protein n=1 Tax=Panagrolaimus superbus TaxID=310955 RepID=A0A914Z7J5_9BILA
MVAINSFLRIFIYFFCNPQFRYQIITNFRLLFNKTKSVVQCEENCTPSNENSSNSAVAAAEVMDSPIIFKDVESVQLHSSPDENGARRNSRKGQQTRADRGSVTFDTSTLIKIGDTCYL